LVGKEISMFVDRHEVKSGPLDELSFDDLDRLIQAIDAETARHASNAGESGDTDSAT
jgi:hypothetical protein